MPNMLALSVVKEIGPVITALILAGRLGAGIGAEIGSMRVTEQIDALEVAALKPFHYLVITRVVGCTLMFPVLTVWTDFIALSGAFIESSLATEMDYRIYISTAFMSLRISDILVDTLKTVIFGFIVGIVSCYLGYNVRRGYSGSRTRCNAVCSHFIASHTSSRCRRGSIVHFHLWFGLTRVRSDRSYHQPGKSS